MAAASPPSPPPWQRGAAAGAVALAAAGLAGGLLLPAVHVTTFSLFDTPYSIASGLVALWRTGEYGVFALILLFSVLLPFAKLAALAASWLAIGRLGRAGRQALGWLHLVGRWAMLDVMVAAVLIVILQGDWMIRAKAGPGLYLFAAATLASMALAGWTARRRPPGT